MSKKSYARRILLVFPALLGLWACFLLSGIYAENTAAQKSKSLLKPKSEPQSLARSSLLPVIADGQTLGAKGIEANKVILRLDKETQSAKSKLPEVATVFEPIHLGLTKPAKAGQFGGGMSSRLDFIEKNLAKSLQDLAKLPSTCDASGMAPGGRPPPPAGSFS